MLTTVLSSLAGDDVMSKLSQVEATGLWRDVNVESCWRQCCRVMLATALSEQLVRGAMYMLSHAGDNAAESC
jgi:hypothetical protein